jgi:hypothetical protein
MEYTLSEESKKFGNEVKQALLNSGFEEPVGNTFSAFGETALYGHNENQFDAFISCVSQIAKRHNEIIVVAKWCGKDNGVNYLPSIIRIYSNAYEIGERRERFTINL